MNIINEMYEKYMSATKSKSNNKLIWLTSSSDFKRLRSEAESFVFKKCNNSDNEVFGITIKLTNTNEIMLVQRIDK